LGGRGAAASARGATMASRDTLANGGHESAMHAANAIAGKHAAVEHATPKLPVQIIITPARIIITTPIATNLGIARPFGKTFGLVNGCLIRWSPGLIVTVPPSPHPDQRVTLRIS